MNGSESSQVELEIRQEYNEYNDPRPLFFRCFSFSSYMISLCRVQVFCFYEIRASISVQRNKNYGKLYNFKIICCLKIWDLNFRFAEFSSVKSKMTSWHLIIIRKYGFWLHQNDANFHLSFARPVTRLRPLVCNSGAGLIKSLNVISLWQNYIYIYISILWIEIHAWI